MFASLLIQSNLFSAVQNPKFWQQSLSLYVHFFIIQIYSRLIIYPKSASIHIKFQGHFFYYLLTQNNIPILSAYLAVTTSLASFEIHNTVWFLAIWGLIWFPQQSTCSLRKLQNLIFHINPIPTAVKNIITTIFSKASWLRYIKIS